MSVILAVLKIIGIVLLILLGLAVLICAAVLFVPVRYFAECRTEVSIHVGFAVTWLLHMIKLEKGTTESRVRLSLFGVDLEDMGSFFHREKPYHDLHPEKSRVNMVDDFYDEAEKKERSIREEEKRVRSHIETDYEEPKEENVPGEEKKYFSFDKISSIISFIRDSGNQVALRKIRKELFALLRYVVPDRIKGKIVFGTGDPCTTGWVLGIISMVPAAYTEGLQISPDFEERVLDVNAHIKGKVRLIYFLRLLIRGYRDEDIMRVIRKAMK